MTRIYTLFQNKDKQVTLIDSSRDFSRIIKVMLEKLERDLDIDAFRIDTTNSEDRLVARSEIGTNFLLSSDSK